MTQRQCKGCSKMLPEGYKHKYCENCRMKQAAKAKKIGKSVLAVMTVVGSGAIALFTGGKIGLNKK